MKNNNIERKILSMWYIVAIFFVTVADQVSKQVILSWMYPYKVIEVTSFFHLVLVFNRGITFGIFSDVPSSLLPWYLFGLSSLVTVFCIVWLYKTRHRLTALGLSFIIGGAIGNSIDRVFYGAVIDFLDFHISGWHWPAFNVADTFICLGAAVVIYSIHFHKKPQE